jgi:CRISPR-associated protein Csx16
MTTYFVSRHAGAMDWAMQAGVPVDQQVSHLNPDTIQQGDIVIGTLPVNLIADINELGAKYWHLSLNLPAACRGKELNATEMQAYGARLEAFHVIREPKS